MQAAGEKYVTQGEFTVGHSASDSRQDDPPRLQILNGIARDRLRNRLCLVISPNDGNFERLVIWPLQATVLVELPAAHNRDSRAESLENSLEFILPNRDYREVNATSESLDVDCLRHL